MSIMCWWTITFTLNLMARENLRDAVGAVSYLNENAPEVLSRLEEKIEFFYRRDRNVESDY